MKFPISTWGTVVVPPPDEPAITAICVEPSAFDSYCVCVRQGAREFDIWLENQADVEAYLSEMQVVWPSSHQTTDRLSSGLIINTPLGDWRPCD